MIPGENQADEGAAQLGGGTGRNPTAPDEFIQPFCSKTQRGLLDFAVRSFDTG